MRQRTNIYVILGWLAMVAVPFAPAFFFGWRVYAAVLSMSGSAWLSVPVGIIAAAGLEIVGIYAGHLVSEFWRRGDGRRTAVSVLIMVIYVTIGVYELRGTIGMVMFIIAPLVYVLVALHHSLQAVEVKQEQEQQARLAWELQQEAKDRELVRQLKLKQQADNTAVKLARLTATSERSDNGQIAVTSVSDWRLLPELEKRQLGEMTSSQIMTLYGVSSGTARRWLRNAREMTEEVSVNGGGK